MLDPAKEGVTGEERGTRSVEDEIDRRMGNLTYLHTNDHFL